MLLSCMEPILKCSLFLMLIWRIHLCQLNKWNNEIISFFKDFIFHENEKESNNKKTNIIAELFSVTAITVIAVAIITATAKTQTSQ